MKKIWFNLIQAYLTKKKRDLSIKTTGLTICNQRVPKEHMDITEKNNDSS